VGFLDKEDRSVGIFGDSVALYQGAGNWTEDDGLVFVSPEVLIEQIDPKAHMAELEREHQADIWEWQEEHDRQAYERAEREGRVESNLSPTIRKAMGL
jgi:hypothetical protein